LRAKLDAPLDPFFTPPWNRCTRTTAECLADLGFALLSRDRGAPPLGEGLRELPVDIDWCKRVDGAPRPPAQLALAIADAVAAQRGPVGIMLHHAVMDEGDGVALGELLALLGTHPACRCVLMRHALH
jgi:hypothetical protein